MKLKVNSSPHIRGSESTSRIMRDVILALTPAALAGVCLFGTRVLGVAAASILAALAGEWLWQLMAGTPNRLADGSAVVTGLLLALTLPASVPYPVAAAGGFFATFVVKGLGGGAYQNIFNPALAARAFLLLLWPASLTRFVEAGIRLPLVGGVDAVTAATPLHEMQMMTLPESSLADMFLGNIGGCIGEVSAAALLLGGIYLLVRKVISPRIPLAYLGSVAVISLIFSKGEDPVGWMLYSLLGGGVILGAFFMTTDYATSPVTPWGQVIYGIGAGALTVFFRYKGLYPEGVTYAILLMNGAAWFLDQKTAPRRFGCKRETAFAKKEINDKRNQSPAALGHSAANGKEEM